MSKALLTCTLMAATTIAAAAQNPQSYTIEQFLASTTYSSVRLAPDGESILTEANTLGVFNVYRLDARTGTLIALTNSATRNTRTMGWFPDGRRTLVQADEAGNELNQLFVRESDGALHDLTAGNDNVAAFHGFSLDGSTLFVSTNERDPSRFDLYAYDARTYERRLFVENTTGYALAAVSNTGRYVAFTNDTDNRSRVAYVFDTRNRSMRRITASQTGVVEEPKRFTRDERHLLLTSDSGSEHQYLVSYELGTDKRTELLKLDWDVSDIRLSRDEDLLSVLINENAAGVARLYRYPSMRQVTLPDLPAIQAFDLSGDGKRLALLATDGSRPADVYLVNVEAGITRQLTQALNPQINATDLPTPRRLSFRASDGLEIPGLMYLPPRASAQNKVAGVVSVHGGPGGQSVVEYRPLFAYLVNHGYALFLVNNRGSGGYGKTFYHLDDLKHGGEDLRDCVEAREALIGTGVVDSQRIAIAGASYGGFITVSALVHYPKAFAAGVDIYGVTNWYRTLTNVPSWWGASLRSYLATEIGSDEKRLRAISPLFKADRIQRPLLVLQGANDPRVSPKESSELVAQLRERNIPVEYLVFPDEGHGIVKRGNQARAWQAVGTFLDRHLAPASISSLQGHSSR